MAMAVSDIAWVASTVNNLWHVRNEQIPYTRKLLRKRKLSHIGEKYDFHGENFCGLLVCQRTSRSKILWRKLLWIATKPWNLWKFKYSPSKVSHYMVLQTQLSNLSSYVVEVHAATSKPLFHIDLAVLPACNNASNMQSVTKYKLTYCHEFDEFRGSRV